MHLLNFKMNQLMCMVKMDYFYLIISDFIPTIKSNYKTANDCIELTATKKMAYNLDTFPTQGSASLINPKPQEKRKRVPYWVGNEQKRNEYVGIDKVKRQGWTHHWTKKEYEHSHSQKEHQQRSVPVHNNVSHSLSSLSPHQSRRWSSPRKTLTKTVDQLNIN